VRRARTALASTRYRHASKPCFTRAPITDDKAAFGHPPCEAAAPGRVLRRPPPDIAAPALYEGRPAGRGAASKDPPGGLTAAVYRPRPAKACCCGQPVRRHGARTSTGELVLLPALQPGDFPAAAAVAAARTRTGSSPCRGGSAGGPSHHDRTGTHGALPTPYLECELCSGESSTHVKVNGPRTAGGRPRPGAKAACSRVRDRRPGASAVPRGRTSRRLARRNGGAPVPVAAGGMLRTVGVVPGAGGLHHARQAPAASPPAREGRAD
jgi:hypothetical protein